MIIKTERTILRNWREGDLTAFHRLHSDPKIMEHFPFRRTLKECIKRMATCQQTIQKEGFGWSPIEFKETKEPIGIAGLLELTYEEGTRHANYEIGWRLIPEKWGQGLATEAASAWLDFAFDKLNQQAIIATAVHQNEGSISVMKRLGMSVGCKPFAHPDIPKTHNHLQPSVLYKITREEWLEQKKTGGIIPRPNLNLNR